MSSPSSSTSTSLAIETFLVTAIRGLLYHACQRFLLRALFHDLRSLTRSEVPSVSEDGYMALSSTDVELDTLPMPTVTSHRSEPTTSTTAVGRMGQTSLHSMAARAGFSLCFSESCMLFLLVMCQGLGILGLRTRELNWKISLFVLLGMILLVIPLTQNILLSSQTSSEAPSVSVRRFFRSPLRLVFTILPYTLYLLLLSYVPLPAQLASSHNTDLLSISLSRLVVLGTIVLGFLSGFGAISNAWDYLPFISTSKSLEVTEQDVLTAEQGLLRIRNDLLERRREQERRESALPKTSSSWLSSIIPNFRGNTELSALHQEITGLAALEYQMDRNFESVKQRRAQGQFNRTLRGKVIMTAGKVFAVYCVLRIISSVLNILFPRRTATTPNSTNSYPDLITHVLAYLVSLLPTLHLSSEDISALSRAVSLALVGVIITSSLRAMLWRIGRLLRLTSQNLGASLMLLILAQLMGMYLLSTLVQLRTAFPLPPSSTPNHESGLDHDGSSSNLFLTLPEFEVFGSLFDWSFLLSAGVTLVVRWFDERVNGVVT